MVTKAKSGVGTTLTFDSTAVGEGLAVRGPGQKRNTIDVTNFDSGDSKEYIAGPKDPGTLHFEMNHVFNAGQIKLNADDGTAKAFVLTYPNGYTYTGTAILVSFEPSADPTSQIKAVADFEITGTVTKGTPSS
jgi:hypothetical protein